MIQFDCPKCLQQIKAHDHQAGQRVNCPSCAMSLLAPAPSTGNFDDLFDTAEEILDATDTKDSPQIISAPKTSAPKTSAPLSDKSLDTKSANNVQPIPTKRESPRPTGQDPIEDHPDEAPLDPLEPIDALPDELSDVFEDLQFPEASGQSTPTTKVEIPTEDPFAVDPDKPLEVDGITDLTSAPAAFSLKCPVCESHLFVTTHAVGRKVKCADCFSELTVPKPTKKQLEAAAKLSPKPQQPDELKIKDAQPKIDVDPSFGFAPVSEDLLAPVEKVAEQDDEELKLEEPTELFGGLAELQEPALPSSPPLASQVGKSKTGKSKTDHAKTGHSKTKDNNGEKIDPYRSRSAQIAKRKKRRRKQSTKTESTDGLDFPEFEFDQLFSAMVNLVTAPTVAVRSIFAALFLAAGNVVGHWALANYCEIQDPTMGDTGFMWFWRAGVGWTLFGLGTIFLWYTAGVIFRKAAARQRRIDNWRIGPSTEWTSTLLLMGFSFMVAGSPLMMFGATWLSAPLRFLFALPMLVSVWFTQSPFKIIALDAFSRYRRQWPQWKSVWLVVLALASIAFTAGLMMAIPVPYLNMITSLIGAVVLSSATLGYAAVAGWHSGKVVEELN